MTFDPKTKFLFDFSEELNEFTGRAVGEGYNIHHEFNLEDETRGYNSDDESEFPVPGTYSDRQSQTFYSTVHTLLPSQADCRFSLEISFGL